MARRWTGCTTGWISDAPQSVTPETIGPQARPFAGLPQSGVPPQGAGHSARQARRFADSPVNSAA